MRAVMLLWGLMLACALTVVRPGLLSAAPMTSPVATIEAAGNGGMTLCAEDADCDCPCQESCACIARHSSALAAAAPPITAMLLVQSAARLRAPTPRAPSRSPREPALRPPIA